MKRAVLALGAIVVLVAAAVFVGSARAEVTGVVVTHTTTSITVKGVGDGECAVLIHVFDEATGGDVYNQTRHPQAVHFTQAFKNLQPGTDYHVVVTDECSEVPAFDDVVTTDGAGAPAPAPVPQGPDRFIFCAAAGNTDLNGNPIAPGTSLNLIPDQAVNDDHYKGATIGFWVSGLGATCQLTPEQAALAAASTKKVNHVGGTGDVNQPELYTLVG